MTGKHFGWHKDWHRDGARLVHISGMAFTVEHGEDYTDINADESTLAEFQAYELGRGVLLKDIEARLLHLNMEAVEWYQRNPAND